MSRINLLPWRDVQRARRSRQLVGVTIGSWVFAGLLVLGAYQYIEIRKDLQNSRNAFLRAEIDALEEEIKEIEALKQRRDRLISRMDIIQGLQQNRTELVRIIDDLVRLLPEGVYLTSMNKRNDAMVINGRAQSNARVSAFMRNLEGSEWFHDPKLDVINVVNDDTGRVSAFTLQIRHAGKLKADDRRQPG
ncbi:MAG: pilus assembly protein PilN [Proteobacteria bacterium]|nr:MAG: pilus assembly protein PilN [Pseudomonadota bacterium]